jgi:hypothetical protein
MSIIVSAHSVGQIEGETGTVSGPDGYARLVRSVMYDQRLSHCDKLVFARLADCCWQGDIAKIGQRAIARDMNMSRTQVSVSLRKLTELGHIEPTQVRFKAVQAYHLTSPRFGQKQRAGVTEVARAPSGGKRLVSVGPEVA